MAKQTFTTGSVLTAAAMTSLQQTAMLGGSASAKTASYTLVAADAGTAITMSNASATTITVNTGLFSAGDTVTILNIGAGTCTITAGTATVSKPTNASLALIANAGGVLYFTAASTAFFMPFDVGAASSAFKGASIYRDTDLSVSNATGTDITFNLEIYDTDNFHSTSTNTARFTIPTGMTGYYLLIGTISYAPNGTGQRAVYIVKNGSNFWTRFNSKGETGFNNVHAGSVVAYLTAGDYVTLQAYQNSGGAINVIGDPNYGGYDATNFSITYLGA